MLWRLMASMAECEVGRSLTSPDLSDVLLGPLDVALRSCSFTESLAAEDFVDDDFLAATKPPKNGMVDDGHPKNRRGL
jgi:hypothetical protein